MMEKHHIVGPILSTEDTSCREKLNWNDVRYRHMLELRLV